MKSSIERLGRRRRVHAAVLMARLVDRHGRCLRPDLIRSLAYSLFQLDEDGDEDLPIRGHIARPLEIEEVVLPNLVNDASWEVDCSGYNFRHVLIVPNRRLPDGHGDVPFELLYHITDISGEESFVSFRVRMFPL